MKRLPLDVRIIFKKKVQMTFAVCSSMRLTLNLASYALLFSVSMLAQRSILRCLCLNFWLQNCYARLPVLLWISSTRFVQHTSSILFYPLCQWFASHRVTTFVQHVVNHDSLSRSFHVFILSENIFISKRSLEYFVLLPSRFRIIYQTRYCICIWSRMTALQQQFQ